MRELPLNGRSFTDLALLSPGAFINFHGDGKQAAQGFGARISVNGSRPDANLYLLDGTTTNDAANFNTTAGGLSLGVEAIREFRIVTHNFSAEYGKSSGAVVSAVTRAGTNEFHGSVYEFVRNNIFDARNFFNPGELPAFRRNQFGASLGGPVLKDWIFFFANYEGLRQTRGVTVNNGNVVEWVAEGATPNALRKQGWTNKTINPGDQITFTGHPARNGRKEMHLVKLEINGKLMRDMSDLYQPPDSPSR